jgi:hypothetical protein
MSICDLIFITQVKFKFLSIFRLFDTSLAIKTWPSNFALQIEIHAKGKIKWIKILIVLNNILMMWYAYILLIVINYPFAIFDKNMIMLV